jgi:hypothetical protein
MSGAVLATALLGESAATIAPAGASPLAGAAEAFLLKVVRSLRLAVQVAGLASLPEAPPGRAGSGDDPQALAGGSDALAQP